ncbi:MAG TPA: hypothetical protein VF189_06285 [Patescibacteria group bacterium]
MATAKKTTKDSLVEKVVLLGSSLAYLTKGATDEIIDVLERNKVVSTKEGRAAVEKVKSQLEAKKKHVRGKVVSELSKVIDQLGIATKKDLEALKKPAKKVVKAKKAK